MQYLFALLTRLISKAWVVVVVAAVAGGAATVYHFSSANAGVFSPPAKPPVVIAQTGPATLPNHCGPPPVVPEANAGLVLIPIVAGMLVFSSRRLRPAKPLEAPVGRKTDVMPGI